MLKEYWKNSLPYAGAFALILACGTIAGCEGDAEDAAQDAGDAIEDTAEDAGEAVDDAADEVDDAVDDVIEDPS